MMTSNSYIFSLGVVMTPEKYRHINEHYDMDGDDHATSIEHRLFTDDYLNEIETWRSKPCTV